MTGPLLSKGNKSSRKPAPPGAWAYFDFLQPKLSLTWVRDAGPDLRHSYLGTYVGTQPPKHCSTKMMIWDSPSLVAGIDVPVTVAEGFFVMFCVAEDISCS